MKIAFIGAGKMAQAFARGICRAGLVAPDQIIACARTEPSREKFLGSFGAAKPRWTTDAVEAARASDVIILALKPWVFPEVVPQVREAAAGKLVISVATGVSLARLGEWLTPETRLVRAMPNTPVLVGEGATVYAVPAGFPPADEERVQGILGAGGRVWRVEESHINAVIGVSGSGPAYVYLFIEALAAAGVKNGLSREVALALATQTLAGGARMVEQTGLPPLELAEQVKSPKGTTVAACEVLEKENFAGVVGHAVDAAVRRAEELAKGS